MKFSIFCGLVDKPVVYILTFVLFVGNSSRYSDFMVNEVDTEGNIVHLTNLDAPAEVDKFIMLFLLNVRTLCIQFNIYGSVTFLTYADS